MWFRILSLCAAAACLSWPARAQAPQAAPAAPAEAAIALIVPASDPAFARAAEAVREGFLAAHRSLRAQVAIQVIETDATAVQAVSALQTARDHGAQLVVGPLTRNAVNGVVERGDAGMPMLLLNVPDNDAAVAQSQLAFGIGVEAAGALMVREALRTIDPGVTPSAARRYVVVFGAGPLARRTGAAFVAALKQAGAPAFTLDYPQYGADGVAREIGKAPVNAIFLALEPEDAAQVRSRLPIDAPLYATSQINAGGPLLANDLEGVRFVDMPWLLDPDRPAVKTFARAPDAYNNNLQRLYALGIDAYRVGLEWLARRARFELDGVTGWLRVDRVRSARVERTPIFAVFREGRIERSDAVREVTR